MVLQLWRSVVCHCPFPQTLRSLGILVSCVVTVCRFLDVVLAFKDMKQNRKAEYGELIKRMNKLFDETQDANIKRSRVKCVLALLVVTYCPCIVGPTLFLCGPLLASHNLLLLLVSPVL